MVLLALALVLGQLSLVISGGSVHWPLSFSGRELDSQEAWQAWMAGMRPYRPNGCLWASGPGLGRP